MNTERIQSACRQFLNTEADAINTLGEGHINDTFCIDCRGKAYILQCVQGGMDIRKLEYNYALYSGICDRFGWRYPQWLKDREGQYYYMDAQGGRWRMYPFLESDSLKMPLSDGELYACGQGLAGMHAVFAKLPGKPRAAYPLLHDLKHYYTEYLRLLQGGGLRPEMRDGRLEEKIAAGIDKMLATEALVKAGRQAVVHGDAKVANLLFQNGSMVGCIDMDTLMTGAPLEDVADCMRSCCLKDGLLQNEMAHALTEGYASALGKGETKAVREKLLAVYDKICFELGLRYYTDAAAGGGCFKEKYPGYRLQRAGELL